MILEIVFIIGAAIRLRGLSFYGPNSLHVVYSPLIIPQRFVNWQYLVVLIKICCLFYFWLAYKWTVCVCVCVRVCGVYVCV